MLTAAKERFATEGYEKTTLRAIAADAHVDPSMVLYLFGSKEELFRESLRLIMDPDVLVAALTEGDGDVGTRMVRTYLGIWEGPDTAASMRTMLQSATSNADAHEAFRGFMQSYVQPAVVRRRWAGASRRGCGRCWPRRSLVGMAMLRYVIQMPPLTTLPIDELVALSRPTVTRYLTADAAELGSPAYSP